MAYYDPVKDKIVGCKRGSIVWYHERCHQLLDKNYLLNEIKILANLFVPVAILALCMQQNYLAMVLILFTLAVITGEEVACWIYAFRNRFKEEE